MPTSIMKHGSACHTAIKALNDWWSGISSHGSMSLEQFVTFRLAVTIAASIQVQIADRDIHTLPLNTEQT